MNNLKPWRTRILLVIISGLALLLLAVLQRVLGPSESAVINNGPPASIPLPPEEPQEQVLEGPSEGINISVSGPETAGMLIQIAGKNIQLPPDAFVGHLITSVSCPAGQACPEAPHYVIKRANSSISVSAPTGAIIQEEIAEGEEGIFDFLKKALPTKE